MLWMETHPTKWSFLKINKIVWLYLNIPVTSALSERVFSVFKATVCVFTIKFDEEATKQLFAYTYTIKYCILTNLQEFEV